MDQLEEVFLKKWSIKIEYIHMLIKRLDYMENNKNEIVKEFRFEKMLQQIHRSHHPKHKFLFFLYTRAFLGQLGFLLDKRGPRKIEESYGMAIEIEAIISSSNEEHLFTPKVEVDNLEVTPDILSP